MSKEVLNMGAKFLGALTLADFCPRCFWCLIRCGKPPGSKFPGIFTSIDGVQKSCMHTCIDTHGCPPEWLSVFADAKGYLELKAIRWLDEKNSILLTGDPDMVLHDGKQSRIFLGDYKTARYSAGQDAFLPQYRIQLLAYAFLLEKKGYKNPEKAVLIYFEPPDKPSAAELLRYITKTGINLPLTARVVEVELGSFDTIHDLLARTRGIYESKNAPKRREGCKDCDALDRYLGASAQLKNASSDGINGEVVGQYKDKLIVRYRDRGFRTKLKTVSPVPAESLILPDNLLDHWFPSWLEPLV